MNRKKVKPEFPNSVIKERKKHLAQIAKLSGVAIQDLTFRTDKAITQKLRFCESDHDVVIKSLVATKAKKALFVEVNKPIKKQLDKCWIKVTYQNERDEPLIEVINKRVPTFALRSG